MTIVLTASALLWTSVGVEAAKPGGVRTQAGSVVMELEFYPADNPNLKKETTLTITRKGIKLPPGTYKPRYMTLRLRDRKGQQWRLYSDTGMGMGDAQEFEVTSGKTTVLKAGPPFTVQGQLYHSKTDPRNVLVNYRIDDKHGVRYRAWVYSQRGRLPKPAFRIITEDKKVLASGELEYDFCPKSKFCNKRVSLPATFKGKCRVEVRMQLAPLPHEYKSEWDETGADAARDDDKDKKVSDDDSARDDGKDKKE